MVSILAQRPISTTGTRHKKEIYNIITSDKHGKNNKKKFRSAVNVLKDD